jgi:hypothetical protein
LGPGGGPRRLASPLPCWSLQASSRPLLPAAAAAATQCLAIAFGGQLTIEGNCPWLAMANESCHRSGQEQRRARRGAGAGKRSCANGWQWLAMAGNLNCWIIALSWQWSLTVAITAGRSSGARGRRPPRAREQAPPPPALRKGPLTRQRARAIWWRERHCNGIWGGGIAIIATAVTCLRLPAYACRLTPAGLCLPAYSCRLTPAGLRRHKPTCVSLRRA